MRIGVILRTGWRGEVPDMDQPARAFGRVLEEAGAAASAGAECLFVYDHLEAVPLDRYAGCFEAWTMLSAIAATVPSVQIGTLVSGVSLRNPGLLGKMATTVDAVSGGRLIVGLGAGWYRDELRRHGFQVMPYKDRVAATEQTIRALREFWTGRPTSATVGAAHLDGAVCAPRPVRGDVPLWVGGGSPAMQRIAASLADGINLGGTPDELRGLIDGLERRLDEHGRTRADLDVSIETQLLMRPSKNDLQRVAAQSGVTPEEFSQTNLVGTADDIAAKIRAYEAVSVDTLILFLPLASTIGEFTGAVACAREAVAHA